MRILISIILCHFFILALSQNKTPICIWNKGGITELDIDSTSSKLIFGNSEKVYDYDGNTIKEREILSFSSSENIAFDANVLKVKGQELVLPATINDAIIELDSVLFIATDAGLYYSKIPVDIVARKVHLDELTMLGAILDVHVVEENVIMTTTNQLILWNRKTTEFLFLENNFGRLHDVVLDNYGLLWMATVNGLYKYQLNEKLTETAPTIIIKKGKDTDGHPDKQAINKEDKLIYSLESIHLSNHQELQNYVHISGEGKDIKEQVHDGFYVFQNMEPGDYSIHFSAKLMGQKESSFTPVQNIRVNNKVFNYWWVVFGAVGMLVLFSIISHFRNQQFQTSIMGQRDILLAENKALKSEQQSLRLQMNPHFIFNVLNSINGMIAIGDNKNARKNINQFSQLMRSVLNHSRTEYITLEAEIKYLKEYLSLEKVTHNDSFDFEIETMDNLDLELQTLPMIIQPFVENAIIHAFQKIDRQGWISITFEEKDKFLEVVVKDNGQGRNAAAIDKKQDHKSIGLQVVRDRLLDPYGYLIEDLEDQSNIGIGTRVVIKMPLKS